MDQILQGQDHSIQWQGHRTGGFVLPTQRVQTSDVQEREEDACTFTHRYTHENIRQLSTNIFLNNQSE